jgi:hypothetical protein
MRKKASALLGALLVNLLFGLSMAAVLGASTRAATPVPPRCSAVHAPATAPPAPPAAHPTPRTPGHNGYVVAARMGWAMG